MTWFVQYSQSGADHIVWVSTPERAIETACHLLDDGCDVWGIGTGPLTDSIGKDQIARIYDMWVRARPQKPPESSGRLRPPKPTLPGRTFALRDGMAVHPSPADEG